jgi:hypothetical protein
VAISTTGHEHRLELLAQCVEGWSNALGMGDSLFVTVDGDADDTRRVAQVVHEHTSSVFRVGSHLMDADRGSRTGPYRKGVAANKNTGLELMMDNTSATHLFLSDDDTWPLYRQSLDKHRDLPLAHSMVIWGKSRLKSSEGPYADWSWPRGVMLYQTRSVIERVGGMDERFGPGGHEHAEFSMRIHNAHLTPANFMTPASYATRGGQGANALWHAEDMPRAGEPLYALGRRRERITSVPKRNQKSWENIHKIMAEREGSDAYVGFRAHENGRASATLYPN